MRILWQAASILQAIWPFHRQECLKNEFADAVEEAEPKFAAWMRKHGKQATLKDDEVDRQCSFNWNHAPLGRFG